MYLYNITIKADNAVHEAWLKWMKEIYIPELLACDCFLKYEFYRILHIDDTDGATYALQLFAENEVQYDDYKNKYEARLKQLQFQTWGTNVMSFATLMQVVH